MRLEAILDYWEGKVTKRPKRWETKEPSRFWALTSPELFMPPTENYSIRLYLNKTTITGGSVAIFVLIAWLSPLAYVLHTYPQLLHNLRYHKLFIALLSHVGIYWMPYAILFLLVFNYAINFPLFYFWNRRAARLREESVQDTVSVGTAAIAAPRVWLPPPVRPGG